MPSTVPFLGLERKLSIERPLETGEQKTEQDAADGKSCTSGAVNEHKMTSIKRQALHPPFFESPFQHLA